MEMNAKWWFVYNDSSLYLEYFQIVDFIFSTFKNLGIQCMKIPASTLLTNYEDTLANASFLPDNVLFWDKNWQVASKLQKDGMHVYNNADSSIVEDKIATYEALSGYGIIPKTLIYSVGDAKRNLEKIIKLIEFPILAKLSESVHGSNVFRLENKSMLVSLLNNYDEHVIIAFQETLTFSQKVEVKICSNKSQVLSSYKRYSLNDGTLKCEEYALTEKEAEMCKHVCRVLDLDIGGIDIMYRDENTPLVCDVNTQPNVLNIFKVLGINVIENFISSLR